METGITVAIIAGAVSILVAALGFVFTRYKERESDWRKIKLEHYREFMLALSGIMGSDATDEGYRRFAQACNAIQLIAPFQVIRALHDYGDMTAGSDHSQPRENKRRLLSRLLREIRADLGIPAESNPTDLQIHFWDSGTKKSK